MIELSLMRCRSRSFPWSTPHTTNGHWDLRRPIVKNLSGNSYVAPKAMLYFQKEKSENVKNYTSKKRFIYRKSRKQSNKSATLRSRGQKTSRNTAHNKVTICEFTVHDSTSRNGIAESKLVLNEHELFC